MNQEIYEQQNAAQVKEIVKTLIKADVDEGLLKFYDADAATIALASRVLDELCLELNYNPQRVKAESKGV